MQRAAARGLSFGAPTPGESELAELVRERLRVGGLIGIEKLRLVSTGTEATMTAIRLARGATGRDLRREVRRPLPRPFRRAAGRVRVGCRRRSRCPGRPESRRAIAARRSCCRTTTWMPSARRSTRIPGRIAAVITEAAGANAGVLAPLRGFNRALAGLVRENGALLILDEVLTGFRVGRAGWWGLEAERVVPDGGGWVPDLFTFGKVLGGGLPLAALSGSSALLDLLAPAGPVYQAGTLSGNPLAVAAGIATLRAADDAVYRRVDAAADTVASAVSAALTAAEVVHTVSRAGSLFSIAFRADPIHDYADARAQQAWRYPPSSMRCWMPGCRLRRACSRPGSCPRHTMRPRWTASVSPSPRRRVRRLERTRPPIDQLSFFRSLWGLNGISADSAGHQ